MKHFVLWVCPGCSLEVKARGAKDVGHECPRRNNRLTWFLTRVEKKAS